MATKSTAKSKKVTSKKKAPARKRPVSARASSANKPTYTERDMQLVATWVALAAIFLGFVIKAYVIG